MNDTASILIVDDEEVVRRSHLRSLADTGCRAEAAGDGQEAIQVMERQPFDVVLLLSLIHISEPTRLKTRSRMPSSA